MELLIHYYWVGNITSAATDAERHYRCKRIFDFVKRRYPMDSVAPVELYPLDGLNDNIFVVTHKDGPAVMRKEAFAWEQAATEPH